MGAEQFDLSRPFPYDFDPLNPVPGADPSTIHHDSEQVARQVLSVMSRILEEDACAAEIAAELGIAMTERGTFEAELSDLSSAYETLCSLLDTDAGTTICLSHESPFGTELDYHHSADSLSGELHSGSIPLRLAIATMAPLLTVSGHTHHQQRDAARTAHGYRDLYNPGSPGVVDIQIDIEEQTVRIDENPLGGVTP